MTPASIHARPAPPPHLLKTTLCLALGLLAPLPRLAAAADTPPPPAPDIALRGPEVVKLDWNTRALQAVDLNADGLNDLVVADNDHSGIQILYQIKPGDPNPAIPRSIAPNRWTPVIEDARFRKISVTTGVTVHDLVVGDLNSDGRPDLAYTGEPQALTLRYQQADGKWTEKKIGEAPAPIQFVGSMRLADLNADGRPDLAVLGQKELAVYHQQKNGELAAPDRYALPDDNCYGLEICDIDGDGLPDLAYLCANNRDALRVRLQTATHQFGPEQAHTIKPTRCTLQILAQAAKDAPATFACAHEQTGQLEILTLGRAPAPGADKRALRPLVFTPRPGNKLPFAYAIADYNDDGADDIAVADPDGAQVFLYLRHRDGGFTTAQRYPVFSDARGLAAGEWGEKGRAALFVASPKEQSVGVSFLQKDGRLSYPKPLPLTGKPLAIAAGDLADDGRTRLVVLREEKGKRSIEIWARKDDTAELVKTLELTGLKTDPRALRLLDANQDGRLDIAVFTPLEPMRLYVQEKDFSFTEASAAAGYRKGLVDNLDAAALTLADTDGDKNPELIVSGTGFTRALRMDAAGELTVVEQYNARDPGTEIATTLVLPPGKGEKRPLVVLYDRKGEQFQTLAANEQGIHTVTDTTPAGKIDPLRTVVHKTKTGAEAFILGKDRFWWLPLGTGEFTPATLATHATDLPDVSYGDVIAGDLNNDGRADLVCVDPQKNLVEILSRGADDRWTSRLHFKVFETDEHFQGRKGNPYEPRETIIADVTGDGKKDLVLLVHDRVLVYPQE